MTRPNHKYSILKSLYNTELQLTAADFNISNANQYLIELEEQGLITRYEVKRDGMSSFKINYVNRGQREKAKKYLGIIEENTNQDEVKKQL